MMQNEKETKKELKKSLRKEIKSLRASHTDEAIHGMSLQIRDQILTLPEYRNALVIYAYVDCKHEVETSDIIRAAWADGKRVAVPKVLGSDMKFFYITSLKDDLEEGYFGIREPYEKHPADEAGDENKALMLMPGVAFDEERHRIGYGGGFYDRFLEAHPGLSRIALAFEFQVKSQVPYETFDICPTKIVTEKRIIG